MHFVCVCVKCILCKKVCVKCILCDNQPPKPLPTITCDHVSPPAINVSNLYSICKLDNNIQLIRTCRFLYQINNFTARHYNIYDSHTLTTHQAYMCHMNVSWSLLSLTSRSSSLTVSGRSKRLHID